MDLESFLEGQRDIIKDYLEDSIEFSLLATRERFGSAPDISEIRALIANGSIQANVDLEKYLFEWELAHFNEAAISATDTSYLDWFDPGNPTAILLLLPIINGWDTLAEILHQFQQGVAKEGKIWKKGRNQNLTERLWKPLFNTPKD